MDPIDLRSDTVTRPTSEMRRAMAEAEVGDETYREDRAPAGGAGGGAAGQGGGPARAQRHHGQSGLDPGADPTRRCGAGRRRVAHLRQRRRQPGRDRRDLRPTDCGARRRDHARADRSAFRPLLQPPPTLLCLENTHNTAGGTVVPRAACNAASEAARTRGMRVHVDGARIFNAATAQGLPAADLVRGADTSPSASPRGWAARSAR